MKTSLPAPPSPSPRRRRPMLSRVANSLYWLGRYFERAENTARLLDVNLQLLLDFERTDDETLTGHWLPILRSAGDEALFFAHYSRADSLSVTEFMTLAAANPNSILSCLSSARENARMIRERISLEMWESVNGLHLFLQSASARTVWQDGATDFYARIKNASHLFQGLTDASFPRDEGYDFIQLGRFLERAERTIRLLDLKYHILLPESGEVGGAIDTAQWRAVLHCASGLEAYRRFYVSEILPWKVVEFLLFSESFPRSVRHCLGQMDSYLRRISGTPAGQYAHEAERLSGRLLSELNFTSIDEVFQRGLHEFLGRLLPVLEQIGGLIYETFMAHNPVDGAAELRLHQQEEQQQQRGPAPRGGALPHPAAPAA